MSMGYSADVEMQLWLGSRVIPVSQLGPDFIILDEPFDHPPAQAELFLRIDAVDRHWPVFLPKGIGQSDGRVQLANPGTSRVSQNELA